MSLAVWPTSTISGSPPKVSMDQHHKLWRFQIQATTPRKYPMTQRLLNFERPWQVRCYGEAKRQIDLGSTCMKVLTLTSVRNFLPREVIYHFLLLAQKHHLMYLGYLFIWADAKFGKKITKQSYVSPKLELCSISVPMVVTSSYKRNWIYMV